MWRHFLDEQGAVARRDFPAARSALWRACRAGRLVRAHPGVYVAAHRAGDLGVRLRAAQLWLPGAVFVGATAASLLLGAPPPAVIELAHPFRVRVPPGFRVHRRRVPAEAVVALGDLRVERAEVAAVELAAGDGGATIDAALRAGVSLGAVRSGLAYFRGSPGTAVRRAVVHDSRDRPWSPAERLLHRLLRDRRIPGWAANAPVVARGRRYLVDVALRGIRLAIEVDGRAYHASGTAFESDRARQNDLVAEGWHVLRFTWAMLDRDPAGVVAVVTETIAALEGRRRPRRPRMPVP